MPALVGALVRRAARRQAPARAALTADLVEVIDGAPELAALGREDDGAGRVAAAGARLARLQRRDALAGGAATAAGTLMANGAAIAVAAVGVAAIGDGALDGVLLAAVVLLALGSFEAVTPLPDAARHLGAGAKAAERLAEITAAPAAVRDPTVPQPVPAGDLALEDVRVRYEPGGPWVLDGVDAAPRARPPGRARGRERRGQDDGRPAAVRFLDPEAGRVTLGGVDLRELAQGDVRRVVRSATRTPICSPRRSPTTCALARPEATDAEHRAALAEAGLGEWIRSLPDGIATPVGRGGRRSPAASASASRSRACCSPARPSSSSTSPPPTWIPPAAGPSSSTWRRCPAIARCS